MNNQPQAPKTLAFSPDVKTSGDVIDALVECGSIGIFELCMALVRQCYPGETRHVDVLVGGAYPTQTPGAAAEDLKLKELLQTFGRCDEQAVAEAKARLAEAHAQWEERLNRNQPWARLADEANGR